MSEIPGTIVKLKEEYDDLLTTCRKLEIEREMFAGVIVQAKDVLSKQNEFGPYSQDISELLEVFEEALNEYRKMKETR